MSVIRLPEPLCNERGQATVFLAVMLPLMLMVMGLAVYGGNIFVQYRHMQTAADMAALVGAEDLPCSVSDTSCQSTAATLACTYAQANGFSGCTSQGSSAPSANVPPKSCSPYNFLDYGNDSTNTNCHSGHPTPTAYGYIEVRLTLDLGTIPIFNKHVTLNTHAVAVHGVPSSADYALLTLSQTSPLSMGGSVAVTLIGAGFSNNGITISGSGGTEQSCGGGWFAAGTVPSSVTMTTDSYGNVTYSPPGCTGTNDVTVVDAGHQSTLNDPYCSGYTPPTLSQQTPSTSSTDCYGNAGATSMTNCPECSQAGWWYNLTTKTWSQGGSPSGNVELFPGIYTNIQLGNGDQAYFNPGVYTVTGSFDGNHGGMCVFGAPTCQDGHLSDGTACDSEEFTLGTTAADQWFYQCSPYGFWDSSAISGRPSALATVPTYYGSSTPLNGITIYLAPGASIAAHGNGGTSGYGQYLAASNPCPGTGTQTGSAVSFPAGAATGTYTYTSTDLAYTHGFSSASAGQVYPSADFSELGECGSSLLDWQGEFARPQHLHFLFYGRSATNTMLFNGANQSNWFGAVYDPNASLTVSGAGKGAGGPPWVTGQIVVGSTTFNGNGSVDVFYRPCGDGSTACGAGAGTRLVE